VSLIEPDQSREVWSAAVYRLEIVLNIAVEFGVAGLKNETAPAFHRQSRSDRSAGRTGAGDNRVIIAEIDIG